MNKIKITNSGGRIRLDDVSMDPKDFIIIRTYCEQKGLELNKYFSAMFESEAEYIRRHNKVTDIFKNAYDILETKSNAKEKELHKKTNNPNL